MSKYIDTKWHNVKSRLMEKNIIYERIISYEDKRKKCPEIESVESKSFHENEM